MKIANATVLQRSLLTKNPSSKPTYHVRLCLKGQELDFKPGDSLGIYGKNAPSLVERLLNTLHASGEEQLLDPRSKQLLSLRDFLSFKANICRLNSNLVKLVRPLEENPKDYTHSHDLLDLLSAAQTQVEPQALCNCLLPLLPRFYSVASSRLLLPDAVDLTVALTSYTHQEETRYGIASYFLCHLAKLRETPISFYVQPAHRFALPPHDAPIIMVGPGTGVAPFRAFLQERHHLDATGKNWLFFGHRQRSSDFFYEEDWGLFIAQNRLRLSTAFSRDQSEKIYVQHRMLEESAELFRWLEEGAYLYVCGDATQMAKDVEATLQQVLMRHGNLDPEAVKEKIKQLKKEGRYLLDIY